MRPGKRKPDQLRRLSIQSGPLKYAEGSALIKLGNTQVLCAASVEESVPPFLRGSGRGWVTAEYGMLPRSTQTRSEREGLRGRVKGRSQEIQRLIGRSLRAVTDLEKLGERTVVIDCDVLQADGGTRCASITGGFVALALAVDWLLAKKLIAENPLREYVAAVSVGRVSGRNLLDLDYSEDREAEVDCNVVMTESGRLVEVQGTAEGAPFSRRELNQMLTLADRGIQELFRWQRKVLAGKK
jgi:ribonuclease PH